MEASSFELVVKIYLKGEEEFFGPGPAQLLKLTKETRSINAACKAMHMAYSKGWRMINRMEKELGFRMLNRSAGGKSGGGSTLTEEGEIFLSLYMELEKELKRKGAELFQRYFPIQSAHGTDS